MSLRLSFKPGALQSLQAADYFTGAVTNLLEGWVDRLEPQLYLFDAEDGGTVHLRVWSDVGHDEAQVHHLITWLLLVEEDLGVLSEKRLSEDELRRVLANWLTLRHDGGSFLVERSVLPAGGAEGERLELSCGVLSGRTVLVSTESMMFAQLNTGLYGLTVAGRGSYLVEERDDRSLLRA
jgi:hypothetical protein